MVSQQVSQQLLGVIGVVHVARFAWLFAWAVRERQPAIVALVFLAVALLALIPAAGLVLPRLGVVWWVTAFAIDAVVTLALVA